MTAMPEPRCEHPVRGYKGRPSGTCGLREGHPGRHRHKESLHLERERKENQRKLGTLTVRTHGYGGYTNGCRCEICADAKADYMAMRRAGAFTAPPPETDPAVTHGTRFAYEERGCRCDECATAERASSRYAQPGKGRAA